MRVQVHELSRRSGNSMAHEAQYPAPEHMGNEVISAPAGTPIEAELRLTSVMEGILVSGSLRATARGECVRCLAELSEEVEVEVSELYLYPEALARAQEEGDEDLTEMLTTDGETLDLEPLVRDLLVTALPYQPVCDPDCPGLCSTCGVRLADAAPGHHHDVIDPRLAALQDYFATGDTEEDER